MSEKKELKVCSICKNLFTEYPNNAWPVNNGQCCDACNIKHVVPERVRRDRLGQHRPENN